MSQSQPKCSHLCVSLIICVMEVDKDCLLRLVIYTFASKLKVEFITLSDRTT